MLITQWLRPIAAAVRRYREDAATLSALDRLDGRARAELETLVRLRRDAAEFDSKGRSVRPAEPSHIASRARRAHS